MERKELGQLKINIIASAMVTINALSLGIYLLLWIFNFVYAVIFTAWVLGVNLFAHYKTKKIKKSHGIINSNR